MPKRAGQPDKACGEDLVQTRRDMVAGAACASIWLAGNRAAQAAPSPALINAAKAEGKVVWYTGMIVKQLVRPLVEAFGSKYGIELKYATAGDSETVLKLTSQARARRMEADVFDSPGTAIPPLTKAGLIEPFAPTGAAKYSAKFRPPSRIYTAMYALYLTTAYNTARVKPNEAPRTYNDLLDPKWKGRMVWTDTRGISGPPGFIGNILKTMGQEQGMAYLGKLAQQKIVRDPGNQRVVLDKVIAGQFAIGLMTYNHHAVISKARGAPVAWLKMEPLVENLGVIALVKNAPRPNAAKLFLEYLVSDEGQKIIREAGYPPADPDVAAKDPSISPATGRFGTTLLAPEISSQDSEPLASWLKIYDQMFK